MLAHRRRLISNILAAAMTATCLAAGSQAVRHEEPAPGHRHMGWDATDFPSLKKHLPIAGRTHSAPVATPDDLVVDPLGPFTDLAGKIRNRPASDVPARAPGGGTMDIGEIAVLEDDGTLVDTVQGETNTINIVNAFYETHADEYDELVIFTASTYAGDIDPEAGFAFFQSAGNHAAGIGRAQGLPNASDGLSRLVGWCNMNDLPEYPASFAEDFFGGGVASGVEIMGQEFLHAFGAFVQPDPATGADILGRSNAHWSFFLHHPGENNASPMEGNRWRSLGGGSFETVESFTGLCELDEYVMGLRAPEDVVPFFVIDFAVDPFNDSRFPALGVTVTGGTRIDLTVDDIVANHGPRLPDVSTSMKQFKVAFILVIPPGTTATPEDLAKIDSFRISWENYFRTTTEDLGDMVTALGPLPLTVANPFMPFDAESPGQLESFFEYNQGATIDDTALAEPSGTMSLRLNGGWGGGDEVRSRMIDLADYGPGELRFEYALQRTGGGDAPEAGEDLLVEYVNANGDWSPLNVHLATGDETDTTFTPHSIALPGDAYHASFRYRFRRAQGDTDPLDDWYVDDVKLAFLPTCPEDVTKDQLVDIDDMLDLLAQWGDCPAPCTSGSRNVPDDCTADTNRDCTIDIVDLLALLSAWGACLPANDDIEDARFITDGSFIFDTSGATTDGPADCPGLEKDLWYCYQSSCFGVATFTLCGTGFDAQYAVYDGCDPATMQLIACGEAGCGEAFEISFEVTPGELYMVRVGGDAGATGSGALTVSCAVPVPENDLCADAIPIGDGDTAFSTLGASTDGPAHPACAQGGDGGETVNDIWYAYTAGCTGLVTVSTCDRADFDTDLVVYAPGASCPPTEEERLACNDDAAGCDLFTSTVSFVSIEGVTYLIRVGGWSGDERGTGTITIGCDPR